MWQAWLTLLVIVIAVLTMMRDLAAPATAVLGGTVVLLLSGVIDTQQAFSGFSNPATLTIAVLYILAAAASKTGLFDPVVAVALGEDGTASDRRGLSRLLPPVALASSVLNNTPIVATLAPIVSNWAERHHRSPSRYLMPISFAAILGGTLTLIGTSTNLVVSGLLESVGYQPFGFFEITKVGIPIALAGVALVIALAPRLLPDHRSTAEELTEHAREFTVDMTVDPGGPLDGVTVREAGLRDLHGVFLVQLTRGGDQIAPIAPDTRLRAGDRLRFAGKASDVLDLQSREGLSSTEAQQLSSFDLTKSNFYELAIGAGSPLLGMTLKEAKFRGRYQAAVVAIHRAGQRIDAKLGEVPIRVGDSLVALADPGFRDRWRGRSDFLLIAPLGRLPSVDSARRLHVGVVMVAVVALAALQVMPVLNAVLLGAVAVIGLGVLRPGEARRAVDLDVVLLIAGGFGLAAAMESSGLARVLADGIVDTLGRFGDSGALLGIVLATILLTETVSNTAAALIIFPVAVATATSVGLDVRAVAIAVALAASASFLTPVGYQTNTMVYGPGGYRYRDYSRLGLPITVVTVVLIVLLVPVFWTV